MPNVPFCCVLTAFMLTGVIALGRRHRQIALLFTALFVLFPLPYYFTHASTDYRQPIEPEIVATIGYGLAMVRARKKTSLAFHPSSPTWNKHSLASMSCGDQDLQSMKHL